MPDPAAWERLCPDPLRSYGAERDNVLIYGENLAALAALRQTFEEKFRCIYVDPPFNSGRVFSYYDDRRSPAAWRTMMHERLRALRPLLATDGAMFVEIDDTELARLQLLLDDVFGRENRVSTITVVRSASTGHKAINRGPVNVTDFLLVYARDKARWRCHRLMRARADHDRAYNTVLLNPESPADGWVFLPLTEHLARSLRFAGTREAVARLGRATVTAKARAFALEHASQVVRFAQPRFDAVSAEARAYIERSRREPDRVFRLARTGHKDLILRGGNRILFLADKVREEAGRRVLVEPLTNVWDDIAFQGIAREGGVVFSRNKKPERLLERIFALSTDPGDWVLDPFLGSGTAAAVALKMRRRWVGIEKGKQLDELCIPRLRRVVDGADPTGITRAHTWRGGGGFEGYTM